ncbi:hypothetical protein PC114_g17743 [Phytophthora cactorum]|nr:hypothetical protein PC114_g17743 [Phytophthora cactorum]
MRTSFLGWEDKQLVQIALEFGREGIRVTWADVARRMAKSKRTATELRLRLASLKQTYGKAVKDFSRSFFGGSAPERCLLSSADARRQRSDEAKGGRSGEAVGRGGGAVERHSDEAVGRTTVSRKVVAVAKPPGDSLKEQSASAAVELQAPSQLLAMSCSPLLPLPDAIQVLASVFSDITARDIR